MRNMHCCKLLSQCLVCVPWVSTRGPLPHGVIHIMNCIPHNPCLYPSLFHCTQLFPIIIALSCSPLSLLVLLYIPCLFSVCWRSPCYLSHHFWGLSPLCFCLFCVLCFGSLIRILTPAWTGRMITDFPNKYTAIGSTCFICVWIVTAGRPG